MDFRQEIIKLLKKEVKLENLESFIEIPPEDHLGDYAFPCFVLAKELKKNPSEISANLAKKIKTSLFRVESNGPYLNFFVNKESLIKETLNAVNKLGNKYGKSNIGKSKKVVIEFPSPNTNKPLHLGHLRNIFLGESVSKILEFNGYKVFRVNLNNDRGIHICKSMLAYQKFGNNKKPDKKTDHFVGDFYVLYEKEKTEDLEKELRDMLVKWEYNDKKIRLLWKKMNAWALQGFNQTYKRLGIKFDKQYYESKFYAKAKQVVKEGLRKGIFEKQKDSSVVVKLEAYNLPDKILLRSDETSIYITQDIYLANLKLKDFKPDLSIIVTANEQNLHFKQLFKILELLGYKWAKNLYHLSYGYISLRSGRMKSREGKVVDADNILDDMEKLASFELKKREKLSRQELDKRSMAIGQGALKFFILKYDPVKDFVFNPDESISFEGQTGPYIQYTIARINSILKKAKSGRADYGILKDELEFKLAKMINQFNDAVAKAGNEYKPSLIASYAFELSQIFNEYYHKCPVINDDKDLQNARMVLIKAVKQVLENSLNLLGISSLDRM